MTKPVYGRNSHCQVLKMKVSISLLSLTLLTNVHSETTQCTVIPFETRDGFSGTCCVFFKDVNSSFPKEEVTKQILTYKNKNDQDEEQSNISRQEDDDQLSPARQEDRNSSTLPRQEKVDRFKSPRQENEDRLNSSRQENTDRLNSTRQDTEKSNGNNRRNYSQSQETKKTKSYGEEKPPTKNVTIATKNAFDVPSRCPEGQHKDHTGNCNEEF